MSDIDESLYSRQLYVLGHEAMRRMQASNILIAGMGGLGIEVAKNIILAGVKSVTIHDKHDTSYHDLSTQFYLKESDIGKNRAKCSLPSLSELNSYVPIDLYDGDLSEDILHKFQVVILTDSSYEEQIRIGKFCHSSGIKFLCAETAGVFGKIFCDFGPQFIVNDVNGQAAKCAMISFISKDTTGVVTTFDDQRHDLEDDSYVIFSEVKGMHELNGKEFKIKVLGPYSFSIGDTSSLTSYESGGVIIEVKKPKLIDFKPIDVAALYPEYLVSDYTKMQDIDTIHLAFQALSEFKRNNSHTPPRPWNKVDAENFVNIVESLNINLEKPFHDLNKQLLELFASISSGNLCPLNSVIGGVLAQEAIKAVSGKFHPIVQYFYFDCRECLPENYYELITNSNNLELNKSSRYLAQEIVLGSEFQKNLESQKLFLVGSGALGCEYIKNFAMMGLCTNEANGKLTITDMDTIEKSNLNRQFLFRSWDVQKHKAEVSSRAAKAMNPAINIEVNLNRVGPETENVYTEEFFDSLDLVCNALDNVKARLYIDARCVQSLKPLIESGTLGTSANSQIILPMLTESYSSSQDPPEKTIPLCTLKNFPNAIEHTLQWARDRFEGLFCSPAMATLNYLNEPEKFLNNLRKLTTNQQLEELEKLESILVKNKCTCFKDCVIWARNNFEELFSNIIKQLLFNFPEDLKTEAGLPFWSGLKRCPHPLKFQPTNSLHLEYVLASANLMAYMHGIKQSNNRNELEHMLNDIKVTEFQPKSGVVIKVNDSDETNDLNDDEELKANELMNLFENYSSFKASHSKIFPIEFEKDDDANYHMDFITACSNLRAENYNIAPTDKHNSKLIAGRIIPAIATTTALIVGLDCIELYKIVQGHKKLDRFKNSYVNLALPFFSASEPMPVATNKFNNRDWSFWDRIDVSGGLSLINFLDHIQKEFKISVDMINCGLVTLYSSYSNPETIKKRYEMKLHEIYEEIRKEKLSEKIKSILLDISCSDLQGNDIDFFPSIKYYL